MEVGIEHEVRLSDLCFNEISLDAVLLRMDWRDEGAMVIAGRLMRKLLSIVV